MTFSQTMKGIFSRKPKGAVDNSSDGGAKRVLSKISGAFMLPVSVMAIAGLFLGIGAAINTHTDAVAFGLFIKNLGDPIFGAMPLLFMVAIVISFTDDIGTAVFAGIIAFLVFMAIQTPFIEAKGDKDAGIIGATNDTGTAHFLFSLPEHLERKLFKIQDKTLGIQTLQTSIFGGIIVGFIMSWAYKTFHEIELPGPIAFFGGKRFVALAGIILMIPLAFAFLLIWPWIGLGLSYFGEYSGKVAGLDSFLFGFAERALVPFGLHHVFYAPLWWTGAGGDATQALQSYTGALNYGDLHDAAGAHGAAYGKLLADLASGGKPLVGDAYLWLDVSALPHSEINGKPAFEFFDKDLGINLGRFMQGKFPFMQLGLPAAGAAMVMAAPKENRKQAFGIIFPASLTSFTTGVTEPLEFTFVFLAPALFWGFHALMAAFSFLMMNLLGAHVGMTFSGGFIDTIIYGILAYSHGTNFYWMYVIGVVIAPIYFFVFYWWIKRFDLPTPGRGGNTKLFTKADYKKTKASASNAGADEQTLAIIEAYGGKDNIVKTANCATRLRFDVKDADKVDVDALKAAGAMGAMKVSKTHVQGIFGPKAEVIHGKVKKALATMETKPAVKKPAAKPAAKAKK